MVSHTDRSILFCVFAGTITRVLQEEEEAANVPLPDDGNDSLEDHEDDAADEVCVLNNYRLTPQSSYSVL